MTCSFPPSASDFWIRHTGGATAANQNVGIIKRAADFVIRHKICCPDKYIERRNGILRGRGRIIAFRYRLPVPAHAERSNGIPRLIKGRVLPSQIKTDQLNVTDLVVHNIAPVRNKTDGTQAADIIPILMLCGSIGCRLCQMELFSCKLCEKCKKCRK